VHHRHRRPLHSPLRRCLRRRRRRRRRLRRCRRRCRRRRRRRRRCRRHRRRCFCILDLCVRAKITEANFERYYLHVQTLPSS
jgi:hypothetical protein